jgi:hypothetical protein
MKNSIAESTEIELNKIFDNLDSKWVKVSFLLSKLDLSLIKQRKSLFIPESIIKLYLYRRIKGINYYDQLAEYLEKNINEAHDLGFSYNENNNLQLPTKRNFNKFFQKHSEIKPILDNLSKEILRISTEKKIVLDINIVKKTIKEKTDSKKELREAVKLVKKLVYPQIKLEMRHNAKFTTKDLLDILVHVALTHDFCNNGSKTFKELYPDMNTPSGDTLLYHFRKLKARDEIEQTFRDVFDIIFNFAKKNYNQLSRKLDIAIDTHDIPYYGNKNDSFVLGGKQDRGTNHFFKFITCSIVVSGRRFCIDALPITFFDNSGNLVDRLLKRAKEKIRINHVYLDRGFDRTSVISVLKKNKVKFLMPKVRSPTVKAYYDKSEACKARVIENFKIGDETVNLILVDDEEGIKRAFSTNIKISEPIAHYLFKLYSKRWGVETKYRQLEHDFKPRTTSKNYNIRLFYFLFSICLFNLWVLVNICVSLSMFGRVKEKPLITSKLFAIILYRIQIDPGGGL